MATLLTGARVAPTSCSMLQEAVNTGLIMLSAGGKGICEAAPVESEEGGQKQPSVRYASVLLENHCLQEAENIGFLNSSAVC